MASIRLAVGDSVCRTDHAEYQSQSKRYEKRREDVSHSQGKFFHLIGSPIFDRLILNSFKFSYRRERLLSLAAPTNRLEPNSPQTSIRIDRRKNCGLWSSTKLRISRRTVTALCTGPCARGSRSHCQLHRKRESQRAGMADKYRGRIICH